MQENDISDEELFLRKGLAEDVFLSEVHYFIYRTVGENAHLLNEQENKNKEDKLHIKYLQSAAHDLMLLNLSRIYDRRHGKYRVRCLEELLIQCSNSEKRFYEMQIEHYPPISKMSEICEIELDKDVFHEQSELIDFLKSALNCERVKKSIQGLHFVRDKYIAHNEHYVEVPNLANFWLDCSFLLDLAKLFLSIIGAVFHNTSYRIEEEVGWNKVGISVFTQTYWIVKLVKANVDDNKMVEWWD